MARTTRWTLSALAVAALLGAGALLPPTTAAFTDTTAPAASTLVARSSFSGVLASVEGSPSSPTSSVLVTPTSASAVAAGGQTTCAITDGRLSCWGLDDRGQVGDGDGPDTAHTRPVEVAGGDTWSAVAVGDEHACGLRTDHSLWCWGKNDDGQLGDGTTTTRTAPVEVVGGAAWSSLATGGYHTCATRTDGTLWCWGFGGEGALGLGDAGSRSQPVRVGTEATWARLAAGRAHTCATHTDGTLWCWGRAASGQVGDGRSPLVDPSTANTASVVAPLEVAAPSTGETWLTVAAGANHTCAVLSDQGLWCWGYNNGGQLGDGSTTSRAVPTRVDAAPGWVSSTGGQGHTCAVRAEGTLWCWGFNNYQQLADGTSTNRPTPQRVGTAGTWTAVAGADGQTCGVRTDDGLLCWGRGEQGQLGDGSRSLRGTPAPAGTADAWDRVASSPGQHTCARRTDRSLWCWGANDRGQLGGGTTDARYAAARVDSETSWVLPVAGGQHSCGLRSDRSLWCWGAGAVGQLGSGAPADSGTPVPVVGGPSTGWSTASAGTAHTCALGRDRSLWCWGSNARGRLGTGVGGGGDSSVPARVTGGAAGWSAVAAGSDHTCAVGTDRSLWCWGAGGAGQLGSTGTADAVDPARVTGGAGATGWSGVVAGAGHTCATSTEGALWCWGAGGSGQLGGGTSTDSSAPVRVGGDTGWQVVAASLDSTCAVRAGALWCWGATTGEPQPEQVEATAPARVALTGRPSRVTTA